MSFKLPELGYDYSALEPFIDAKTMEIHHSKHHGAYVTNLNNALDGAGIKDYEAGDLRTLYGLLMSLDKLPEGIRTAVRNNGGGHANHSMFWELLKKPADGKTSEPSEFMKGELEKAFGSYEKFVEQFKQAGMTRFGSGWAWLVIDGKTNKLAIISQPNQDNPVMEGHRPVMGVDVWEHAYYLKHQNVRANWLNDFFSVLNWAKVEENYNKALGK